MMKTRERKEKREDEKERKKKEKEKRKREDERAYQPCMSCISSEAAIACVSAEVEDARDADADDPVSLFALCVSLWVREGFAAVPLMLIWWLPSRGTEVSGVGHSGVGHFQKRILLLCCAACSPWSDTRSLMEISQGSSDRFIVVFCCSLRAADDMAPPEQLLGCFREMPMGNGRVKVQKVQLGILQRQNALAPVGPGCTRHRGEGGCRTKRAGQ